MNANNRRTWTLTNVNIKPNTIISNEDFLKFLYFIDPTYKKLNPYKKGIIEELELPEQNPKEKQIEKQIKILKKHPHLCK